MLPPSIRKKTNELNDLHGDEPTDPPREWNSQPPAAHFKTSNSPPNTSTVLSAIIGRLNNHEVDNGDVNCHLSEYIYLNILMNMFQIWTPPQINQ